MTTTAVAAELLWQDLERARQTVACIDLVESVRLMELDEAGVIRRWLRFVQHMRADWLPACGGRLVKSLGDGALVTFASPLAAVRCCLRLQHEMAQLEKSQPEERRLRLRAGVHTADFIVDGFDVFGSGVNLTSRLTTLAGPGEVVVSAEVRDALADGLDCEVHDLGERYLKHVGSAVRAFRVGPKAEPHVTPGMPWWTEVPALAVVPFAWQGVAEAPPWGSALAESLIACLSGHGVLRVISILSSTHFSGTSRSMEHAGQALGAAYVLWGRCGPDEAGMLLVSAHLTRVRDGQVVWSDERRIAMKALLGGGEEGLHAFAAAVGRVIVNAELGRARALPLTTLEGYTLYVAGVTLMHRLSRPDFERAGELLEHLADRHPRSAAPHAMLSKWHMLHAVQGWVADRVHAARLAQAAARRAQDIDPEQALAMSMEAMVVAQTTAI